MSRNCTLALKARASSMVIQLGFSISWAAVMNARAAKFINFTAKPETRDSRVSLLMVSSPSMLS